MTDSGRRDLVRFWRAGGLDGLEVNRRLLARRIPPHVHDSMDVSLITAGAGYLVHGRNRQVLTAGEIVLINPGEPHTALPAAADGVLYEGFQIDIDLWSAVTADEDGHPSRAVEFDRMLVRDTDLAGQLARLHRAVVTESTVLEQESRLTIALSRLGARYGTRRHTSASRPRPQPSVQKALDYLHVHATKPVRLTELAAAVGLSPYWLARCFADQIGMPPHSYQIQLRLQTAFRLLRRGYPIRQVASLTGFADQAHLTRTFRHYVGITPGRYRTFVGSNGSAARAS